MAISKTAIGVAALLPWALTEPAFASSTPHFEPATLTRWALSVGCGASEQGCVGLAFDTRLTERGQLGFSVNQEFRGVNVYSIRGLFQLAPGRPGLPGIAMVGGLWGAHGAALPDFPRSTLYAGFSLVYPPRPGWSLRLNLGYSLWNPARGGKYTFATEGPLTGFELGYALSDTLEFTVGWNGVGELAGLNWRF